MQSDRFEREFQQLGLAPEDIRLLPLLPAVHVAWANGNIDEAEHLRLFQIAEHVCQAEARDVEAIEHWLLWRPAPEYFRAAMELFRRLAVAADVPELDLSDLQVALAHAETMSRTRPGAMDRLSQVDLRQERALAEISWLLGIDHGAPWSALLREIEPAPPAVDPTRKVA